MPVYLILWMTLVPNGGVVSSTGASSVAMSIMGAPITHIPFSDMKACEIALKKITARTTLGGVCVSGK